MFCINCLYSGIARSHNWVGRAKVYYISSCTSVCCRISSHATKEGSSRLHSIFLQLTCCHTATHLLLLFLLWWPWQQRLSTASAEATFGPMCNPVCARVSVCMDGAWLLSYRQCVFSVCESLVLYIYSAQSGC